MPNRMNEQNFLEEGRELHLYYEKSTDTGKQTLANAKTLDLTVNEHPLAENNLTETQIARLSQKLNLKINQLVNREHPLFGEYYKDKEVKLSDEDSLILLSENSHLMKSPIVEYNGTARILNSPSDVFDIQPKQN